MTDEVSIALAQLNPTVGRLEPNLARLRQARTAAAGADLVLTSELFLCGYPPEDLVRKPQFVSEVRRCIEAFAPETGDGGPAVLLGAPWQEGDRLYNTHLLIDGGRGTAARFKHDLPNYGVFDE